ncbi:hypothetical protein C8J57DRAFT_1035914, partial [Mycena rebaudengoi]
PCGFCGQAISDTTCSISLTSGKAVSSCPEWYQFMVKPALKSSAAKPCINSPVKCFLCSQVHWKYNLEQHLRAQHPSWEVTMEEKKRDVLRSLISLTHDEETRLGVP